MQPSLFDQVPANKITFIDCEWGTEDEVLPHPRARRSDPVSSHEAAAVTEPGNGELVQAIREVVRWPRALSQFEIAAEVGRWQPGRWQSDTIRSACARAGLTTCGRDRRARRWVQKWTWRP